MRAQARRASPSAGTPLAIRWVMRYQNLRVGDLMTTAVLSVKDGDLLTTADVTMKMADVRHLPVIDRRGHVVGVLSNRDVLGASRRRKAPRRVGEVMSRTVMTVRAETRAAEAAALMLQYKIGSLPVVGDEEELIGVITETDLLRVAHEALGGPTWAGERATRPAD
jgi:CBS domain-containing protein